MLDINHPTLFDNEYATFDMYFASLCSMQVHPGAGTKEHRPLTLDECKELAMDMLKIRRALSGQFNEDSVCRG